MNLVIAGPTARGYLLAARLSTCLNQGDTLTLFAHRPDKAKSLERYGFSVLEHGTTTHFSPAATASPKAVSTCEFCLLCCRPKEFDHYFSQISSFINSQALVVALLPGVAHLDKLHKIKAIPAVAINNADCHREQNNTVVCNDAAPLQLGLLNKQSNDTRLIQLSALFQQAGYTVTVLPAKDIIEKTWTAFCIDLAVNPLAALYKRPNGHLLTSCSVRGNLKKCLCEAMAVARAEGISLTHATITQTLRFLRTEKQRTAPMLHDILNKQPTDIQALNGYISKRGKMLSIPTPVNDDLTRRVRTLEKSYA